MQLKIIESAADILLEKIKEVKRALECKCYLSALALVLTLPDICGKMEYPNYLYEEGASESNNSTWFDNWVNHLYADSSG